MRSFGSDESNVETPVLTTPREKKKNNSYHWNLEQTHDKPVIWPSPTLPTSTNCNYISKYYLYTVHIIVN